MPGLIKVGLTGGIGSGKTTVAHIFEVLGIPVYYADDAAKRLMQTDEELKKDIIQLFGPLAYEQGILNRSYIAKQVFGDKQKLNALNSIVHPATIRDAAIWMAKQQTHYAIKEAALIFETLSMQYIDSVILVYAPIELRIRRTMARDNITREQVLQRMANQMDEEEKKSRANFIIYNDESQAVLPQVMAIHKKLMETK